VFCDLGREEGRSLTQGNASLLVSISPDSFGGSLDRQTAPGDSVLEGSWEDRLRSALASTYTIERELGGGGMSRVFLATENALGRQVVIKVLPPGLAEGVSSDRFTREIRVAARLQHPHIVPLLSAGEALGVPWFAMPFVEGESLRERLKRSGELPVSDVLRILREVAGALAYAHGRGVVHRDIKPENVLLSGGTAMVSDFGVAKALADSGDADTTGLTSLGVALGTPAYMAPEQGMADPRMDQRADIYAFGILGYELLTGRTPFQGRSPQATLAAHVTEVPEPVERLRAATPPTLAALVMQCLAKSPADRPQSAQELVQAIDGITTPAAGTTPHVTVPATGAPLPVSAAHRSSSRTVVTTIGAAVLMLAAVAWLAASRLREPPIAERRIAVAPFENLTGDPQVDMIGRMAADWLSQGIARAESVEVVSTLAVTAAMADAPKGDNPVERLARLTRASVVVAGTIYPQGDSLRLQGTVVDARSGRELLSLDPVVAPRADPIRGIETLRERLLGAIAMGADTGRGILLRAPSFAAYQEYLKGEEMFTRDQAASRPFFERAIALDSMLVPAYSFLAVTYSNANIWDSTEAVTRRLERFKDRFTPFERSMFEWLEANLDGSLTRQLAAAQATVARDSIPGFLYLVGLHANAALQPAVAKAALEKSDSAMVSIGWRGQVAQLANAHHLLGEFGEELAMLRWRRRDFPGSTVIPSRELRALGALGRREEALALTDTLLRGITDAAGNTTTAAVLAGALEFESHHTDTATANTMARRVVRWHQERPNADPGPARLQQEGRAWLLLGGLDSAEHAFRRWTVRSPNSIPAAGYLALALALKGDSAQARHLADSLGTISRKWLFGNHTYYRGVVLAALGEREVALRLLQQSFDAGVGKASLHNNLQLRSLRGYPPFEALRTPDR
jgi:serine/threonine protein kinase/TolB-like protein/tetratricopeptide (TPR) repeat protein